MINTAPEPLGRVIDWLTSGYPDGIPATDRFAVIALLKRRLTDEQVRRIVTDVTLHWSESGRDAVITQESIEELIQNVLREPPSDVDIQRVSARLAAGGWPIEHSLEAAARREAS